MNDLENESKIILHHVNGVRPSVCGPRSKQLFMKYDMMTTVVDFKQFDENLFSLAVAYSLCVYVSLRLWNKSTSVDYETIGHFSPKAFRICSRRPTDRHYTGVNIAICIRVISSAQYYSLSCFSDYVSNAFVALDS